jgi:hypothetical protein
LSNVSKTQQTTPPGKISTNGGPLLRDLTLLRGLKGAPLACLVALAAARQAGCAQQNVDWLARASGYSAKPIAQALKILEERGLAAREGRYLWRLEGEAVLPALVRAAGVDGNFPAPSSSSGGGLTDSIQRESTTTTTTNGQGRRVPPAEVLQALDAAGIHEPARSRLARLEHVTAELVEYHARTAGSPGLAIYRIEHAWPVRRETLERESARRAYIEGRYADFIEH